MRTLSRHRKRLVKRESLLAQASPTCIVAYHCCTLAKTSRSSRPVSHLASHLHLHLILAIAPTPAIAPSRFLLPRLVRFLALTRTLSIARLPPPHTALSTITRPHSHPHSPATRDPRQYLAVTYTYTHTHGRHHGGRQVRIPYTARLHTSVGKLTRMTDT